MNRHAESGTFQTRPGGSAHGEPSGMTAIGPRVPISFAINWELGADHRRTHPLLGATPNGFAGKPIDSRRMSRVLKFVSEHIAGDITVADLASVACMSPAHFARSFKATTGQRPHAFVFEIRLALARQMLANRHLPISDIALSTGFSSQSNFSRAFRGAMGMTPRDYRSAVFE